MAQKTVKLYARKWGYVDSDTPVGVTDLSGLTEVPMHNWYGSAPNWIGSELFFTIDAFPSSLAKKRIYYAKAKFAFRGYGQVTQYRIMHSDETFNPATLEYGNKPALRGPNSLKTEEISGGYSSTHSDYEFNPDTASAASLSADACMILRYPTHVILETKGPSGVYSRNTGYAKLRTLSNNSSLPYIEITYDDTEIVTGQVVAKTYPSGNAVNPLSAQSFTWDYEGSGTYDCFSTSWTQKSATFYWKKSTESTYHSIAISGNTKSVTIPAKTFSSASTIQWYVRGVEENNVATETSVNSFSTIATQITPDSFPTGSNVDNRTAKSFTWHFASSAGNFGQSSARLYWRVQDAETWNSIAASGTTQSLSVPAYTFPANSTIEWYLSGTDATGGSSTSQTATFKTLDYTLAVTSAPSGSNVDTRSAKTFSWTLRNTQGDATQKSAVLYWRVQGASTYNQITNNTSTKSISVPANTFPTASTIQWYLRVTASDNTVKTTSVATFNTVSPQIVATQAPSGNAVYTASAITFKWELQSAVGLYTQKSAKLFWRKSSSDAYTEIAISGSTQSVTVPAYTFPTASTIQWYLSGVDAGGHTSTTNVTSFTTVTPQIKATQFPTGSKVDTRLATVIKWEFQTASGNYGTKSATFYWRVSGASTYNAISAPANTAQLTVPANTFPTASTIQWYLAGVDTSGHSSQTSAATFTTVTVQIEATQYPSGSDVFSGAAITFKWHYASDAGDYDQKSAIFYWRTTTTESYRSINISNATQQLVVPANTFPTNSTIYWYLSGLDSSNHRSATSEKNFKTQTTQITPQGSPTSGYSNPRNPIKFSWYFAAKSGSIPQSSANFFWRVQGASTYNQVSASGATTSVTIAANTFPVASIIEWYISGTDIGGTSSQSDVYSFSTTAATAYAIVKSPMNSGVDGSAPITFRWTLTTADGFAPSRVILQWKLPIEDSQHWHTIIDSNVAISEYVVDGNTFPSGEINWRVIAYNVDSVAGPESTASFVCIVAPTITTLSASPVPFSVVSWQASDQQGFQIEIDGVVYGPYSGTEKEFPVPDYLRDGVHTVRLRILGGVDMWSEWASTTVSIQNVPSGAVTVQGYADVNVTLEWQAEDSETDFYIYRDGKLIGRTSNNKFIDRLSLGRHEYAVVNRLADGNYSKSEVLSRKTCVEYMYLAALNGVVDVNIAHGLKSKADPVHTLSQQVVLTQLAGRSYPNLTVNRFCDNKIECSAVFLYTEEEAHKRFQRLMGKAVVAKLKDGTCCVAVIDSWNRTPKKEYYTAYEFTLKQIDWEDYDDTQ